MPTYYSAAWVLFGILAFRCLALALLPIYSLRCSCVWGVPRKLVAVDKIVSGWQSLGWPLPTVAEETRPDYVVLTLQLG